jgi:hypothetical protein
MSPHDEFHRNRNLCKHVKQWAPSFSSENLDTDHTVTLHFSNLQPNLIYSCISTSIIYNFSLNNSQVVPQYLIYQIASSHFQRYSIHIHNWPTQCHWRKFKNHLMTPYSKSLSQQMKELRLQIYMYNWLIMIGTSTLHAHLAFS